MVEGEGPVENHAPRFSMGGATGSMGNPRPSRLRPAARNDGGGRHHQGLPSNDRVELFDGEAQLPRDGVTPCAIGAGQKGRKLHSANGGKLRTASVLMFSAISGWDFDGESQEQRA